MGQGSGAGRGENQGGGGPQFSGSKGGGCWEWVNLRETPESPRIWKKVAWFPRAWKGHEDRVLGVGRTGWEVEHLGFEEELNLVLGTLESQEADLEALGAGKGAEFLGKLESGTVSRAPEREKTGRLDPRFPKALKQWSWFLLAVRPLKR